MVSGTAFAVNGTADVAAALALGLGEGFAVVPAGRFVAVAHPALGLAAVVPSADEAEAMSAATDLTALAASVGVTYPSMHFAISSSTVKPPWVVRASSMDVDILSAMAKASARRPPFDPASMAKVVAALARSPLIDLQNGNGALVLGNAPPAPPQINPSLLRMIERCVERPLDGHDAWVCGVVVDASDIADPNFMLPALLIAAAEKWAIPVVASKGKGGFLVRLSPDSNAILGYRVSGLDVSSPLLLFLPIVNLIRRSRVGGEFTLDAMVELFARFLKTNDLDSSAIADVEVRVATSE